LALENGNFLLKKIFEKFLLPDEKEVLLVKLCQNKIMLLHSFSMMKICAVQWVQGPNKVFERARCPLCDDIFMVEGNF